MALVTPIINYIPALNATRDNTITFVADGGEPIVKNEIKILTNDGNETVVYNNTQTTTTLGQTIPANTLTNGVYYKVVFRTYDALDNTSEWSNYQPFYCFSTPTLTFNISDEEIIHTTELDLSVTYNQAENERLESVNIYFFNANGDLISSSGKLFNSNLPPVTFNYFLSNLENNETYRVKADGVTVDGTVISTGIITFYVSYEIIDTEGKLYPNVDSCEGYINVKSSPIINVPAGYNIHNPAELSYIDDDTKVDLTSVVGKVDLEDSYSYWVKWYDLYPLRQLFLFRLWFYPARTKFQVAELVSEDGSTVLNSIKIKYERGETEDYISIRSDDGIEIDRGLGTICNGNTKVFLWISVKGQMWDVRTEILSNPTTTLDWNNSSDDINYNVTTDIPYGNETYGSFEPVTDDYHGITDTINAVIIGNGVFDTLLLDLDADAPYSTEVPTDDTSAILFVNFNGSVDNEIESLNYTKALLQRKDDTMLTWWNLQEISISAGDVAQIDYNDGFLPSGIKQTYGLTIYKDDIPSKTYTVDVVPKWGRVFLSDKDESYKLNYAVIYSNGSQNIQNGALMPIGTKYPIVIQNAVGNYKSGSLQFKVLGYQFDIDRRLDRNSIVEQTNDILAFLANGKPKCIKDYNGNIYICKVINSPQISYDANWGNGITTISFDWVEQAQYNNYDEMLETGIINNDVVPPTPVPPTPVVTVKPFDTATDEEFAEIISGYYNGDISLEDIQAVWSIGDTRDISLDAITASGGSGDTAWSVGESHRAQTVTIQILDFVHDDLTTSINGKTKALITVDLKDCLRDATVSDTDGINNTENGYINSLTTNTGGWINCDRRKWCNNGFYQALPLYIRNLVVSVEKLSSAGGQSSNIVTTSDYVFLPSEIEVFNQTGNSFAGEGTIYAYYNESASNRIKLPAWNSLSTTVSCIWWGRSPAKNSLSGFCIAGATATSSLSSPSSNTYGIAPTFCM